MIEYLTTEATDRPLFDRDHDLVLAHQVVDEIGVERLGKTGISDGRRQPVGSELLRRLHALGEAAAKTQQRDRGALADDAAAADLDRYALLAPRHPDPLAAPIAHRRRPSVDRRASCD